MRSNLAPLWLHPSPRQRSASAVALKEYDPVPVVEQAKSPPPVEKPPSVEYLSVDDAHSLSIKSVNLLVRENPALVARMIIDSGRRRRGELPLSPASLRPMARFILLCGQQRRAEELTADDRDFMIEFLEEIGAS